MAPVFGTLHEHLIVGIVAEGLCNLRDAEVAVGCIHRLGGRLFYTIRRTVFVLEIVLNAAAAIAGVCISWLRRMLLEAFIRRGEIEAADPFGGGVSEDGIDEAAGHAGAIAGAGERWKPAAFLVCVDPGLQDFAEPLWEEDGHQRVPGTIYVPVSVVGIHDAGSYGARVGTAVLHGARGVGLVPNARKEQRSIKAGVEGSLLVEGTSFDLDAEKMLVPDVFALLTKGFSRSCAHLMVKIALRLFEGDEGGCDAYPQCFGARRK